MTLTQQTIRKANQTPLPFSWRVYGLGVIALGVACLAFGEPDPGQPISKNFPARTALAYATGVFMVIAAAAVEWRRTAAWGAAALTFYYAFFVVLLLNGRLLLTEYRVFVTYENIAQQLVIAVSGLIIFAATANIDPAWGARLTRLGRVAFGVCALVFGGAHFVYMNLTAPLVPRWLPPTQEFWGYATGVGFIAAGLGILTSLQARLAAILMTAMLASFTLLVHVRLLMTDHSSHSNWTDGAINLAVVGAAWVLADSLAPAKAISTD